MEQNSFWDLLRTNIVVFPQKNRWFGPSVTKETPVPVGVLNKCSLYRRKSQAPAIPGLLRWWPEPRAAKMTDQHRQIGFSQRIQLDWLEKTIYLAANGKSEIGARCESLSGKLSVGGQAKHSNREKAVTILLKVWVTVPIK